MRARKAKLRACAPVAFKRRGYAVTLAGGAGVVRGARWRGMKEDGKEYEIAVRTSSDRKFGCTRQPDGRWSTISRMDEVILIVPSREDQTTAEVFSFDPAVLIAALDEALAIQRARKLDISHTTPIFVPLDDRRRGSNKEIVPGIKSDCNWRELVPLGSAPNLVITPESGGKFIDRVKREYALLNEVDVSKVKVSFRIEDD
jgi:hypothetical protein